LIRQHQKAVAENMKKLLQTDNSRTTILIRLMVGLVFFSEGIQKFLYPLDRGAGRFAKIGFPEPDFLGNLVGSFETACGLLILLGLFTRFAAVPLIVIMTIAITATKLDILLLEGAWEMLHESRTDWAMLLGSIFLLFRGGGKYSLDRLLFVNSQRRRN
jgi:putative oxidoreductase